MKSFRKSVIRLFLATFFLLFIAWVGMKAMQYHGDYERMIRDAQRYLRENGVVAFVRDKAIPAASAAFSTSDTVSRPLQTLRAIVRILSPRLLSLRISR